MLGTFAYALSQRVPLGLDVIRDRKTLFRERAGRIENVYTLKVLNMNERPHRYELHAERIPFPEEVTSADDARRVLIRMLQDARARA